MITFKDIEKEKEKLNVVNSEGDAVPTDDKSRNKKLIKYAVIGAAALVGGFLIYKYVLVKKKGGSVAPDSKMAEF